MPGLATGAVCGVGCSFLYSRRSYRRQRARSDFGFSLPRGRFAVLWIKSQSQGQGLLFVGEEGGDCGCGVCLEGVYAQYHPVRSSISSFGPFCSNGSEPRSSLLWAPFDFYFYFYFDARSSEYSPRSEIPLTFSHLSSVFGLHHHAHHPTCHA